MPVEVKRAGSRVYERLDWLHAWHCLTGPAYGLIHPGLAQRMTAGAGILHSERNDSWVLDGPRHERDVEMVQMWVARGRRRDPDPEPVRHPVGRATAARGVRAPARRAVGAPAPDRPVVRRQIAANGGARDQLHRQTVAARGGAQRVASRRRRAR